jgi:hypothetical protein
VTVGFAVSEVINTLMDRVSYKQRLVGRDMSTPVEREGRKDLMTNIRKRRGVASEYQVFGQLLDAGLDVYATAVDDQGIDAVLRVESGDGAVGYFDVQMKSARSWNGIRGKISSLGGRKNTVLILFNSRSHECLWLDAAAISEHFPGTGSQWGDVFLDKRHVEELRDEGRGELDGLARRLSELVT